MHKRLCFNWFLWAVLWKMLSVIELLIAKDKKYDLHYTTLVLNDRVLKAKKEKLDMKFSYILLCIKNALSKLMKYQELLP